MSFDVRQLVGRFVTEVGLRQVWPFLTLCDNRPTPANELRLYVDTIFEIKPGRVIRDDDEERVVALVDLNNRTVSDARVGASGELAVTFDDGERVLVIAGEAADFTSHDVWWLGMAASI